MGGSGRVRVSSERLSSLRSALEMEKVPLLLSLTDSVDDAETALALRAPGEVAIAIACAGATSTESRDRTSLELDQHKFLVELGARTASARTAGSLPPLAIIAQAPGAVVAEWARAESADAADAAAIMFLGGEQTGRAWADVLLGRIAPSGKLPLTLPRSADQGTGACPDLRCEYTEELLMGWKGLVGREVEYPFGHGLSYANFKYELDEPPKLLPCSDGRLSDKECSPLSPALTLSVRVVNLGSPQRTSVNMTTLAASEVVQLYLGYPPHAAEPPLVLRAFNKTRPMRAGEGQRISFTLNRRDMSVWDVTRARWRSIHGTFSVSLGSSSRDLRLNTTFDCHSGDEE